MQQLNFPEYEFRFKGNENNPFIFDIIRKKFVILTPEEWVRQHVINFLVFEKKYPSSLLSVEKQLLVNKMVKRYDIVGYHPDGNINLLVECKSPKVKITQQTFDQIARYNMVLDADYLMITNGLHHYCCKMDTKNKRYEFKRHLPVFSYK